MSDKRIIQYLENFICDNPELEKIEKYYEKFNIFDCIGINKQEIKHSNFLAWLFNPKQTHGLADFFIKEFLKQVLLDNIKSDPNQPTVFDIDCWDMSEVNVIREYKNIDILFIDNINKFICVIENKIETKQHSNQLTRYKDEVNNNDEYKEYKKLFLYLKPIVDGDLKDYIYVSYDKIVNIIDKLIEKKESNINKDLLLVIEHYKELLLRDVMNDIKIKEICQTIYKNHKNALEIIYENIEAFSGLDECQVAIADLLKEELITTNQYEIIGEASAVRNISFIHKNFKNYKPFFKFKIWNAIMKNDFSLVLEFLNVEDLNKQQSLCEYCGITKCTKTQNAKSFGRILTTAECKKLYKNFEQTGEISQKWKTTILENFRTKINKINVSKIEELLNEK